MTDRVYTTAMGRPIDIGALAIKNQNTPAVGNMKVDAGGKPLKAAPRTQEVRPTAVQVQPGRITNVQRVPVDATATDAQARLRVEAAEHEQRIAHERAAVAAAAAREQAAIQPEPITEVPVAADTVENTMLFSADDTAEPAPIEPADTVVTVASQPSALAAAAERAQARRGGRDV